MTDKKKKRPPAVTETSKEQRLINMAYNRAEEMLVDGTAPPSIISFFLKLGSSSQKIDNQVKGAQAVLHQNKADALTQESDLKSLTEEALIALRKYQGEK